MLLWWYRSAAVCISQESGGKMSDVDELNQHFSSNGFIIFMGGVEIFFFFTLFNTFFRKHLAVIKLLHTNQNYIIQFLREK